MAVAVRAPLVYRARESSGLATRELSGFLSGTIEAEYEMRVIQGGSQFSYMVLFAIEEDGVWRVKFF
jgi:hypothetical protein